ncbi:CarD family transcriptional regulator [Bradyrhizobium sp. NFR13]|uniref:CarD family transcriptional regulator n=1 Tax=Bradyrhizobium sp. NFR13 TaxID=1566285 RepID=UPI000B80DBE0|nr:CarD family transcriptional regulator [Bradyrhizobium sp. NFR13]
MALPGSRLNIKQGRGGFHAQAVSQKTRKKSVSKAASKKATASKVLDPKASKKTTAAGRVVKGPAAKNSVTKGRARAPVKDTRTAAKAAAEKSSKNKRSAMPNKTAKPAPKAAASKTTAAKPAAPKPAAKAPAAAPAVKAAAPKEVAKVAAKPVVAKPVAAKPAPAAAPRAEEPKKPLTQRQGFKTNEFVVYPAHGVGQILAIEEQEIAGARLELFVINFMKDKMTLRVPTAKVMNVGMRKLSEPALVKRALETLKGRARIKRTMWSRRAQEYEAKINSGDIVAIAEVVRDLFRSDSQPEQSYSERQLYEAALDRLSREIAVVQHVTETEAVKEIEGQLAKSPRRGAKAEAGAEVSADDADSDGDDDVAAADEAA